MRAASRRAGTAWRERLSVGHDRPLHVRQRLPVGLRGRSGAGV